MDIGKADRFGFAYIMQFALDYTLQQQKEKAWKMYCADCLMLMNQSMAQMFGGKSVNVRYSDLIGETVADEKRSADEIIADMKNRLLDLEDDEDG